MCEDLKEYIKNLRISKKKKRTILEEINFYDTEIKRLREKLLAITDMAGKLLIEIAYTLCDSEFSRKLAMIFANCETQFVNREEREFKLDTYYPQTIIEGNKVTYIIKGSWHDKKEKI